MARLRSPGTSPVAIVASATVVAVRRAAASLITHTLWLARTAERLDPAPDGPWIVVRDEVSRRHSSPSSALSGGPTMRSGR